MTLPFDLAGVRASPSMYLRKVEFDTVVAYIDGLNAATYDSLLLGFNEWLVLKCNGGTSLVWSAIILDLAFPGVADAREQLHCVGDHVKAIECLFKNLEEFWLERSTPSGMRAIFLRFQAWLKQQDWYGPTFPNWIDDEGKTIGELERERS